MGKRKSREERFRDVYEAEGSDPEEEQKANQRYDAVENFQYELPEDFKDEEIDEEEAFTEEDKQLYAHMFSGKGRAKAVEEDAEDELDGAEDAPLTRDDFSEDDSEADELYGKPSGRGQSGPEGAGSDSEMEDIFAGVSDADSEEDEEEEEEVPGPGTADKAKSAIRAALGSGRRQPAKKVELQDEALPESEYNASMGGTAAGLSLADLLNGLKPAAGKMTAAQKQLAKLVRSAKAVQPSLPRPIKARKERQAGYEATKEDIAKWTPIVRANREAATLVLTTAKNDVPMTNSTAALTAKFQPKAGMEAEVAALLKAAGVQNDQAVEEAEEALALKAVSSEEVFKRRAELAKMRTLLFKHEAKARHLAKIKSKDYHRRLKRAARRKAELAGDADDKEFIRLEAEKAEYERAKERLTLKHKNTSQWARRALKRGVAMRDAGTREAIEEQLRLGQELRRRVDRVSPGPGSDTDASGESGADSDASESGSDDEATRAANGLGKKAAETARAAAAAILEGEGDEVEGVSKGLFSLPFMRRAQEARKRQAEAAARDMLAELDGAPSAEAAQPSQGRRNFGLDGGVQANDAAPDFEEEDDGSGSDVEEDAEAKRERLAAAAEAGKRTAAQPSSAAQRKGKQRRDESASASGWGDVQDAGWGEGADAVEEALGGSVGDVLRRVGAHQASMASRAELLSAGKGGMQAGSDAKRKAGGKVKIGSVSAVQPSGQEDATMEVEEQPQIATPAANERGKASLDEATIAAPVVEESDEEGADPERDVGMMSQRELIGEAFAGDDVAAQFEAEKAAEVEKELPGFEAPSLLPGWGSWASQQKEPRWMREARAKAERQKQGARASRKDAKLDAVVISERYDKKAAKFSAPSLPYPYNSKEAFESSMRQPLGNEFNTHTSFREMTRPAIIKSTGVIIQPLKFSQPVADASKDFTKQNNFHRQSVRRVSGGMTQPSKKRKAV